MMTPVDQRGLFSRLPDDADYWHALTDRIVKDAAPQLSELRENRLVWWSEIERFSIPLAASAAAAVLATILLVFGASRSDMARQGTGTYGLVPRDPIAVTLISEDAPPAMETLIALRNAELIR